MAIALFIVGIIVVIVILSAMGWLGAGINVILSLIGDGLGNCLGCSFKLLIWVFFILLILSMFGLF